MFSGKATATLGLCSILLPVPAFAQETSGSNAPASQPPVSSAPAGTATAPTQTTQTEADPDATLMAMVGKQAPSFTLPDQNDRPVSLQANRGRWIVLAFYPADMTRGCTFQNRSYTANLDKFAPLNAQVFTVSTQDTGSKRDFCSKEGLKHTLLSDVGGRTATAYGVLRGNVARRVTFYINPEGMIAAVDTKPNVQKAAEESLTRLRELQVRAGATQKAEIRNEVVEESDGDLSSLPTLVAARDTFRPPFEIPENLRELNWRGTVVVNVTVEANGTHAEKLVSGTGNAAFDAFLLDYFKGWKWQPAKKNGDAMRSERRIRFKVE